MLADVDAERGEEVAASLGEMAAFHRTDVADPEQIQALVDFAVARFGGLHVFCNNAGIGGSLVGFLTDDFRDFERILNVNLLGAMVGSQRAARHMKDNGGGSIINISSIGGITAGGGVMSYRAAKAALIHVSKSIAVELAPYLIRVNCIAPAHIPTGITTYDISPVIEANQPLAAPRAADGRRLCGAVSRERLVGASDRNGAARRRRNLGRQASSGRVRSR